MQYKEYLDIWLNGIQSELDFWDNFMKNEGGVSFYGYEKTISPNREFELENDIPEEMYGKNYKFLDVGAGPFSRCGFITKTVKLNALAVDPLAYGYNLLKEKYGITNGIKLKNGFVELLNLNYEADSFDMVHMSNALDHCFCPIDGIYQLLNVCKIGGKVILRHHENEALNEGYQGMHQWNLSLHNEENSFVIWRDDVRYDVCKIFGDYADFELIKDEIEKGGHWIYNKVVITKKKDVILPQQDYLLDIFNCVYGKLIMNQLVVNQINDMTKIHIENVTSSRIDRIRKIYHDDERTSNTLLSNKINRVLIYGMGYVGKNLAYLLEKYSVKLIKIDILGPNCGCVDAITLEQCENWNVDIIINTVNETMVTETLSDKNINRVDIMDVDSFLDFLESEEVHSDCCRSGC